MSYDAKQMGAVLTACSHCGRSYYMTAPQAVCVLCRRERLKASIAEIPLPNTGNAIGCAYESSDPSSLLVETGHNKDPSRVDGRG